jgi:hypothetical protein
VGGGVPDFVWISLLSSPAIFSANPCKHLACLAVTAVNSSKHPPCEWNLDRGWVDLPRQVVLICVVSSGGFIGLIWTLIHCASGSRNYLQSGGKTFGLWTKDMERRSGSSDLTADSGGDKWSQRHPAAQLSYFSLR